MRERVNMLTSTAALVKREFIEHRLLFIYTPLLCLLMCTLVFAITLAESDIPEADPAKYADVVGNDGSVYTAQGQADFENTFLHWRFVRNMINDFERLLRLALWCSLAFYYLTTLYQQRQDRSVLFWSSLPVRDSQTILSKLLAGIVLCHALYLFGIAALELLLPAVVWTYSRIVGVDAWGSYLATIFDASLVGNVATQHVRELLRQMPLDILWTLPAYGWFLLASAWSPRAPLMWALGPWLLLIAIELAVSDQSLILDAALAHVFAVDNVTLIPGRVQSQLFPGALLGVLFVYGAIYFNRPMNAGTGFAAVRTLLPVSRA